MQKATKKWFAGNKIRLIIRIREAVISLAEDPTKNYQIKSRGKYKSEGVPQRLKILLVLNKEKGGVSAKKLASLLQIEDISVVRRQVKELNIQFRDLVSSGDDVVSTNDKRRRYFYFLNREIFDFEFKK